MFLSTTNSPKLMSILIKIKNLHLSVKILSRASVRGVHEVWMKFGERRCAEHHNSAFEVQNIINF